MNTLRKEMFPTVPIRTQEPIRTQIPASYLAGKLPMLSP